MKITLTIELEQFVETGHWGASILEFPPTERFPSCSAIGRTQAGALAHVLESGWQYVVADINHETQVVSNLLSQ